jgi:hypothetical protein
MVKWFSIFSISCSADNRLETWDDPTPRNSEFSLEDLREACVAAIERQFNSRAKSPTREERLKYRDEHDRNSLMIALQTYAKKNNMQVTLTPINIKCLFVFLCIHYYTDILVTYCFSYSVLRMKMQCANINHSFILT